MGYRLSVVKLPDEDYSVNYYHKNPDTRLPDFASLINQLFLYAKTPEIFEEEPIIRDLSPEEEKIIRNFRSLILEQKVSTE